MKSNFTCFLLLTLLCFQSCKKENISAIPPFADTIFKLYDLRRASDSTFTDVYFQESSFTMKSDFSWSLEVEGAKSIGTYSWTPKEAMVAKVNFTIVQWTPLNADTALSNKLKTVIQTVEYCSFQGQTDSDSAVKYLGFTHNNSPTYFRAIRK